jgi:hypothetical protein
MGLKKGSCERKEPTMARPARTNHIDVAVSILTEFGGGPLSSKDIVKIAQERGLINDKKYTYNAFLRKLRESNLLDTSVRGQIALAGEVPAPARDIEALSVARTATALGSTPAAAVKEILGNTATQADVPDDGESGPEEVQETNET